MPQHLVEEDVLAVAGAPCRRVLLHNAVVVDAVLAAQLAPELGADLRRSGRGGGSGGGGRCAACAGKACRSGRGVGEEGGRGTGAQLQRQHPAARAAAAAAGWAGDSGGVQTAAPSAAMLHQRAGAARGAPGCRTGPLAASRFRVAWLHPLRGRPAAARHPAGQADGAPHQGALRMHRWRGAAFSEHTSSKSRGAASRRCSTSRHPPPVGAGSSGASAGLLCCCAELGCTAAAGPWGLWELRGGD